MELADQPAETWVLALMSVFSLAWLVLGWRYLGRVLRKVGGSTGLVDTTAILPLDILGAAALVNYFIFVAVNSALSQYQAAPVVEAPTPLPGESWVAGFFLLSFYLFVVGLICLALRRRGVQPAEFFGLNRGSLMRYWWVAMALLLAAYPSVGLISSAWQALLKDVLHLTLPEQDPVQMMRAAASTSDRVALVFLAIVVAPVGEEFVFRGFLQPVCKRYLGQWGAILLTSLLFGCVHGNLAAVLPLFILGALLALAYEYTGSLWTPVFLHMIFNSITTIAVLFFGEYAPEPATLLLPFLPH